MRAVGAAFHSMQRGTPQPQLGRRARENRCVTKTKTTTNNLIRKLAQSHFGCTPVTCQLLLESFPRHATGAWVALLARKAAAAAESTTELSVASLAMRGAVGVRSQSPIESVDPFSMPFPQLRTPAARWAIGVSAASPDRRPSLQGAGIEPTLWHF